MTLYRTIVADPPWPIERTPGGYARSNGAKGNAPMPYPTMTIADIAALPVSVLAEKNAHLYLWTVQSHLADSFDTAKQWGFRVSSVLVWCKQRGGFVGGTFFPNVEFVLFCRRGTLPSKTKINGQWFTWPRGEHSAKPEAFQDIVEQVSPGPYLELFARRARLGWDVWGNEVASDSAVSAILQAGALVA
jgi:N6-adenosine-specific RNA methylase IME4